MPSSSLAKLAARPCTVSLPPAVPSIDSLTAFADWLIDGLIRFLSHTSHECSDCHVESVSNFTEVRKTDISSSDLYRGVVRPVHADAIRKLYLRVTRL